MSYDNYYDHMEICEFNPKINENNEKINEINESISLIHNNNGLYCKECKNKNNKLTYFEDIDLEYHQKYLCECKTEKCNFCNKNISINKRLHYLRNECFIKKDVKCKYCEELFSPKEYKIHLINNSECDKMILKEFLFPIRENEICQPSQNTNHNINTLKMIKII